MDVFGAAFGEADLGHDIRLACFGLDPEDNDFVVGLLGRELFPLSAVVQRMRSTQQTGEVYGKDGPVLCGPSIIPCEAKIFSSGLT